MIIDEVELAQFPYPLVDENPNWQSFYEFGKPWHGVDGNIWANGNDPQVAPFDQKVYFCNMHICFTLISNSEGYGGTPI